MRREAALIVISLMVLELVPPLIASATTFSIPQSPLQLCRPAIIDLSFLGLKARSVEAYIVNNNKLLKLPSIPLPQGVARYGPILLTLLYKGKPLASLTKNELKEVANILTNSKENITNLIKPVIFKKNVLLDTYNNSKLLVLLPCQTAKPISWNDVKRMATLLGSRALAIYEAYGYPIIIAKKEEPSYPISPYDDKQVIKVYTANIDGEPKELIMSYEVSQGTLLSSNIAKATLIRILSTGEQSQAGIEALSPSYSNNQYFLWDIVPWESAKFNSEEAYLGNLVSNKGVEITSTYWSSSDSFKIPPRTTRYEIYIVITAKKTSTIHVLSKLNGDVIYNDDYTISAGSTISLGVIVQIQPEQPGNYFTPWSETAYSVTITSNSQPDIIVKVVPIVRSYVGDSSQENLVYTWSEYIAGMMFASNNYETVENPPIRILAQYHNTFMLRAPLAFLENTATFSITVYSASTVTTPAHIIIGLDGLQLCSGYTAQVYYKGAYRQVYQCTITSQEISDKIIDALRAGRPLLLDVYVNSNNGPWFIDNNAILVAKRRMRLYTSALSQAVASYTTDDPNYVFVLSNPESIEYYTLSSIDNAPMLVANSELYIRIKRPYSGLVDDLDGPVAYLLTSVVNPVAPTLFYGIVNTYISKLHENMIVGSSNTRLAQPEAWAKVVGKGNEDSEIYGLTSIASYVLGAASLLVSDGASTLFGIFSVIVGIPAIFYESSSLSATSYKLNDYSIYAEATWSAGVNPTDRNLGLLLNPDIRSSEAWSNGASLTLDNQVELLIVSNSNNIAYNLLICSGINIYIPTHP